MSDELKDKNLKRVSTIYYRQEEYAVWMPHRREPKTYDFYNFIYYWGLETILNDSPLLS